MKYNIGQIIGIKGYKNTRAEKTARPVNAVSAEGGENFLGKRGLQIPNCHFDKPSGLACWSEEQSYTPCITKG
jgi:hypothetical protein